MTKAVTAILLSDLLLLVGCCSVKHNASGGWEYTTLVTPNDAVPLNPVGKVAIRNP